MSYEMDTEPVDDDDLLDGLLTTENTQCSIGIVRPKFDTKSRSTLRSVLAEYGYQDGAQEKTKKKKKTSKNGSFCYDDGDDKDDGKLKAKQEHYMQVYKDVIKLRDYAKENLLNLMTDKVEQQREDIKKRDERSEKARQEREEKEHQERLLKKKKVSRVEIAHDNTFVKHLPKTKYYKLVSIEDRLRSKGMLRTQSDIDSFWESMSNPAILERYTKCALSSNEMSNVGPEFTMQSSTSASHTSFDSFVPQDMQLEKEDVEARPLTQITERPENSRPATREKVIKQLGKENHVSGPSSTDYLLKKRDPHTVSRVAAQELERKLPQLELPQLTCFTMDLGSKCPSPEEMLAQTAANVREKERLLFVKRIRKMYNISQSNRASTQRIFDKYSDDMQFNGADIQSLVPLIEDEHKPHHLPRLKEDPISNQPNNLHVQPWLKHIKHRLILPIEEVSESPLQSPPDSNKSSHRKTMQRKNSHNDDSNKQTPAPPSLTLQSVQEHGKVLEAKCLSTLWRNYTNLDKIVHGSTQAT